MCSGNEINAIHQITIPLVCTYLHTYVRTSAGFGTQENREENKALNYYTSAEKWLRKMYLLLQFIIIIKLLITININVQFLK